MKTLLLVVTMSLLMLVASCASPESRVRKHQAEFDAWPADVQQKIKAGRVDVGFTQEMVRVALGDPERTFTRTTAQGAAEVWVYAERGPKFSFGVGVGSVRGSTGVGGGVTVGDTFRDNEAMRVVFEQGRVTAIETRR
jgi:hypothetical protein